MHTALLLFPQLSIDACRVNIIPDLHKRALISIRQLCDDDFTATFSKDHLTLVRQNVTITGDCDANNGQYYIDLAPLPKPTARIALSLPTSYAYSTYNMTTKLDLVCYLYRTDFIPVILTWT